MGEAFLYGQNIGEYGTAAAEQILQGYTVATANGIINGTIPSKSAQTFTPTTINQTIAPGQYLSGTQTIQGSANLLSSNIKSGVSMFGVTGTYGGVPYASGTATTTSTGKTYSYAQYNATSLSTTNMATLIVTGLNFRPKRVVIKRTTYRTDGLRILNHLGMYQEEGFTNDTVFPNLKYMGVYIYTEFFQIPPADITNTGFTLPVFGFNSPVTWEAFG